MKSASDDTRGIIRLAPERPTVAWTSDEALDAAKAAYYEARRRFAAAQAEFGHLATRLFDPGTVNYQKLKSLRSQTRQAIDKALATEESLTLAIEAMEATHV